MSAGIITMVGTSMVTTCTITGLVGDDMRWIAAGCAIAAGTCALRRAWLHADRLLSPFGPDDVPDPQPIPVPTDPTILAPLEMDELRLHFERLDQELRLGGSGPRIAIATARWRDKVGAGPAERRAWADLCKQLEDA